jgi:hypothetical protein
LEVEEVGVGWHSLSIRLDWGGFIGDAVFGFTEVVEQ